MDGSCARSRQYKLKKYLEQFRGTTIRGHDHLGARRAGPAFSDDDIRRLPDYARELVEEYAYIDGRGDHIPAGPASTITRDANCLGATTFQMAVRHIAAGEELTDDYGTFNPRDREPFHCSCGAAQCRGAVLPDDYLRIGGKWMKLARAAFLLIPTAPQPLWAVLRERQAVKAALADPSLLRTTFWPQRRKAESRMGPSVSPR